MILVGRNWSSKDKFDGEKLALAELRQRGWKQVQWSSLEQDRSPYDAVFTEKGQVRFVLVRVSMSSVNPPRLTGREARALLEATQVDKVRVVVVEKWKTWPSVRVYTLEECVKERNRVRLVQGAKNALLGAFPLQ